MKYLVITETYHPINQPTAKCLEKVISFAREDYFFVLSKGTKGAAYRGDNYTNIQINSYYNKPKTVLGMIPYLIYKIALKIYSIFRPYSLFGSRRFYKAAKKIISENKIDLILSISGWFSSQKAGSLLSKKYIIPFVSWYTDPFLKNVGYQKYNAILLKKLEKSWLTQAKEVIMPSNYKELYDDEYKVFKSKFKIAELPCFFEKDEIGKINSSPEISNYVLHTGLSFPRINNFSWFYIFVDNLINLNFISLEDDNKFFKQNKLPKNFVRHDRCERKELIDLYSKSTAIVVIDNIKGIQVPSKAFESISTNKPIIFIYHNSNSETYKLMKNTQNVFFVKEGETIDQDFGKRLNTYIRNKTYERSVPYSNEEEIEKIVRCLCSNVKKENG